MRMIQRDYKWNPQPSNWEQRFGTKLNTSNIINSQRSRVNNRIRERWNKSSRSPRSHRSPRSPKYSEGRKRNKSPPRNKSPRDWRREEYEIHERPFHEYSRYPEHSTRIDTGRVRDYQYQSEYRPYEYKS